MELKDFITETLVQMMEGVKNAQVRAKEFGAVVDPASNDKENVHIPNLMGIYQGIQTVEFEVALTEISANNSQKGISVSFASIGGKGNKEKNEETSNLNKIKFDIKIALPYTDSTDDKVL